MLKQQFLEINDGIILEHRIKVANIMANLLADTYTLYLKTHNFHWNVTGSMFNTLHLMFENQYVELALAIDLLAERIRALGFIAPGSYSEFLQLSKLKDSNGDLDSDSMIKDLIQSHEILIKTARDVFSIAEVANDQVSIDLVTQRLQIHEKTVWMLRSLILK